METFASERRQGGGALEDDHVRKTTGRRADHCKSARAGARTRAARRWLALTGRTRRCSRR
ncbi:hypothetical protein TI01_1699 [Lysobacter sp. A03]|nr:hypothetical protein TI01_1699 [Lysobacter sp. A03]